MLNPVAPVSASNPTAAPFASFYIDDGSIARGLPNAGTLLAAGFTGAAALAGSGLLIQSAAPADQSAAAEAAVPTLNVFGRIESEHKFNGRPAFYDAATNTLWDGEQGWTWSHESATGTTLADDLHTARQPYQQSAYMAQL